MLARLRYVVVDEAHTIQEWKFRPYKLLRQLHGNRAKWLWLTGTLTKSGEKGLLESSGVPSIKVYRIRECIFKYGIYLEVRDRPGDADTSRRHCMYYCDTIIDLLAQHSRGEIVLPRII